MAKYKYNYEDIKYHLVVAKDFEKRAAYPDLDILHLENFSNISIDSYNVTPQKKKNVREEDCQEYCQITYDES